jgi:hypothetical protein
MKKITLSLIALLGIPTLMVAQDLYVSPASYMFVQDEVVFVNDDIQLDAADSNIYLRDGAQLVQNTNTQNSDIGELSVYQNQTSTGGTSTGIFEYNYWCSPVGVADTSMNTNVNFDINNLRRPTGLITSPNYGISPTGYNSTATEIKSYWLWQMESGGGYADWSHVTNTGSVATGLGFTMKGSPTANNIIDFRGRPNTGTLTHDCSFSGTDSDTSSGLDNQVETLTGNPYPSAMDLLLFLRANQVTLDGSIYFWEQQATATHLIKSYEGGYATWTPVLINDNNDAGLYAEATFSTYDDAGGDLNTDAGTSGNYTAAFKRRYAAIGQGFMVRSPNAAGAAAGGTFTTDNSMRLYMQEAISNATLGSQFGKDSSESDNTTSSENQEIVAMSHNGLDYMSILENPSITPELRIHTKINNKYFRVNVIGFNSEKNLSYNKFGDAEIPSVLNTDSYFIADNHKLVIKSMAYDIDARLPYGLNADEETNEYSITINSSNNVSDNIEVFVYDKEEDTYTDIKNGVFEITLAQGEYDNRFEIVFKDASKEANEDLLITEVEVIGSFDVFQNNTNNQLVIKNPKSHIVKSFTMYDVTGKLIYNKHNLGNDTEYTFPTNTLSSGAYITKITTDQNFEITKKVIVNN